MVTLLGRNNRQNPTTDNPNFTSSTDIRSKMKQSVSTPVQDQGFQGPFSEPQNNIIPSFGGLKKNTTTQPETPMMSTNNGPANGYIQSSTTPISSTQTPPQIPSSVNQGFAGITKPTIGSDFGAPAGAENTQMNNMPKEVQSGIANDVNQQNSTTDTTTDVVPYDLDKTLNNLTADITNVISQGRTVDMTKLKQLYPELSHVDNAVLNQLTIDMGNVVREGRTVDMNKLKTLYPELIPASLSKKDKGGGLATISRQLSNAVSLSPTGEAIINPLGEAANQLNKLVLKIPTLTMSERDKFAQDNLGGFGVGMGAVPTMITNAIPSFLKVITGMGAAIANPLDTAAAIVSLVFTPEGHQALADRYGSREALGKTMTEDPVGLASDAAMLVSGGLGVAGKAASLGELGLKAAGEAELAARAGEAARLAGEASKTAGGFATMGANVGMEKILGGIENVSKIAEGDALGTKLLKVGGKYVAATAQPFKTAGAITAKVLPGAESVSQRVNRLTKGEQEMFYKMTGQEVGKFINDRAGDISTKGVLVDFGNRLRNNLDSVDMAVNKIQGPVKFEAVPYTTADGTILKYEGDAISHMLEDVVTHATDTHDPMRVKMNDIMNKYQEGKATMTDITQAQRYYQRNTQLAYFKDLTAGTKAARSKNIDSAVREWKIAEAEKNGFTNLREMNKETQGLRYIVDKLTKNTMGRAGNDAITLTDWIMAAPAVIDPHYLAGLLAKKVLQSSRFAKNYVKVINKLNGHKILAEKAADLLTISRIQTERQLKDRLYDTYMKKGKLETPALPFKELGSKENPIIAKGPVSEGGVPEGRLRNTHGWVDAPDVGDNTSLGKVVDVTHTGGGFPKYSVKIEGYKQWFKAEDIDGFYEPAQPLGGASDSLDNFLAELERGAPAQGEGKVVPENFGVARTMAMNAILENYGFKSLDDLPNELANKVIEGARRRSDKGIEELDKAMQEYKDSLISNKENDTSIPSDSNSDVNNVPIGGKVDEPAQVKESLSFFEKESDKWLKNSDYEAKQNAYDYVTRDFPELGDKLRKETFGDNMPETMKLYRVGGGDQGGIESYFTSEKQAQSYGERNGYDIGDIESKIYKTKDIIPTSAGSKEVWVNTDTAEPQIKENTTTYYHGTTKANAESIKKYGFDTTKNTKGFAEEPNAIFISTEKGSNSDHHAGTYGDTLVEVKLDPKAKILDFDTDEGYKLQGRISGKVMKDEGMKTRYDYTREAGYDAVDYGNGEIAVINPEVLKLKNEKGLQPSQEKPINIEDTKQTKEGVYIGKVGMEQLGLLDKESGFKGDQNKLKIDTDGHIKIQVAGSEMKVHPIDMSLGEQYKLPDVIDYPDLYKAYPKLKSTKVVFNEDGRTYYSEQNNTMHIQSREEGEPLWQEAVKESIMHETQHAVQHIEGFNRGGNPQMFRSNLNAYDALIDRERKLTENYLKKAKSKIDGKKYTKLEKAVQEEITKRDEIQKGIDDGTYKTVKQIEDKYGDIFDEESRFQAYQGIPGEGEAREATGYPGRTNMVKTKVKGFGGLAYKKSK